MIDEETKTTQSYKVTYDAFFFFFLNKKNHFIDQRIIYKEERGSGILKVEIKREKQKQEDNFNYLR